MGRYKLIKSLIVPVMICLPILGVSGSPGENLQEGVEEPLIIPFDEPHSLLPKVEEIEQIPPISLEAKRPKDQAVSEGERKGMAKPESAVLPGRDKVTRGDEKEGLREFGEALQMWKMIEKLDLNEEQAVKLMVKLKDMKKEHKAFREEKRRLVGEIANIVNKDSLTKEEEGDLAKKMEQLKVREDEMKEREKKLKEEASKMLTLKQRAQFLVFQEKFAGKAEEMIKKRMMEGRTGQRNFSGREGKKRQGGSFGRDETSGFGEKRGFFRDRQRGGEIPSMRERPALRNESELEEGAP